MKQKLKLKQTLSCAIDFSRLAKRLLKNSLVLEIGLFASEMQLPLRFVAYNQAKGPPGAIEA